MLHAAFKNMTPDKLTPEERLRADLPSDIEGLEGLVDIPGVVPPSEETPPGPGEPSFERMFGDTAPRPLGLRELLFAILGAIILAAIPLREGLFNPDQVQFGLEDATHQEPWKTAIANAGGKVGPSLNDGLSDQANAFYPVYRWISDSWLAGDPPLWNPLIYVGAPALGNPQAGVLDPQILLLVFFDWLGGQRAFDWALSLAAFLRLFVAGLGAYLLARRLGLRPMGACLAGLTFGFSGYLILWLNSPLGHVPPLFPWVLYFLEGLRGHGPGETSPWPARRAFCGVVVAMALTILAGHPETSFFVGFAAGLWALGILLRDRRAGLFGLGAMAIGSLAAIPVLLPFYRYLMVSGAHKVRSGKVQHIDIDVTALGMALFLFVLAIVAQRVLVQRVPAEPGVDEDEAQTRSLIGGKVGTSMGLTALGVVTAGALLWFLVRGMREAALLTWLPDLWGTPGRGEGYFGPGPAILEGASGWILTAALLGALSSFFAFGFQRGEDFDGGSGLRMRRLIVVLGFGALGLVVGVPGVLDLYKLVPLIGLGDTVRFAVVSSLMFGLLAGEGLERAGAKARFAALAVAAGLFAATALTGGAPPKPAFGSDLFANQTDISLAMAPSPATDSLVQIALKPGDDFRAGHDRLEGFVAPGLPIGAIQLRLERFLPDGSLLEGATQTLPCEAHSEPSSAAAAALANSSVEVPEGALFFRASYLQRNRLDEGWWGLFVDFSAVGADHTEAPFATRAVGLTRLFRSHAPGGGTIALIVATAALFAFGRRAGFALLPIAGAQGLLFSQGQNPSYPSASIFPETETERILGAELGPYRYFADRGVMRPNTGLVRGLACLDGYDAIDPLSYNQTRRFALKPGVHPLLGWNARGVDLDSVAFRMLCVKFLVLKAPLLSPVLDEWELVASPRGDGESLPYAETFLYRAKDVWPRAFCVTEAVSPEVAKLSLGTWDPRTTAILMEDWKPAGAAKNMTVSEPVITNNTVTCSVELDGEALFVLADQFFESASFEVNGEEREPIPVNGLFIGVPLGPGKHEVVLIRSIF